MIDSLFPKTVYLIPEGMKLYKEYCFVNIFTGWPKWDCTPHFVPVDYFDEVIETVNTFNPTVETYVGLLFLFAASILAITIIELLYNKLDWFLTPLIGKITKRYRYTIQRNRLRSMNGHP